MIEGCRPVHVRWPVPVLKKPGLPSEVLRSVASSETGGELLQRRKIRKAKRLCGSKTSWWSWCGSAGAEAVPPAGPRVLINDFADLLRNHQVLTWVDRVRIPQDITIGVENLCVLIGVAIKVVADFGKSISRFYGIVPLVLASVYRRTRGHCGRRLLCSRLPLLL